MNDRTNPGNRSRGRRSNPSNRSRRSRSRRYARASHFTLKRLPLFMRLVLLWTKHRFLTLLSRSEPQQKAPRNRERVYVDASFKAGENGEAGVCGIGVWLPRRGVAIALKVKASTSVEGEILAILAGAITAKRFNVEHPLIFSDCKSVVTTAMRFMHLPRTDGFLMKILHLAELSSSHRAYAPIFDALQSLRGSLEWQPRENNREADLASNIGSRVGNMGIVLKGAKNRNHALNDVLSMGIESEEIEIVRKAPVHKSFRSGTRTVLLASRRPSSSRRFLREAHGLIEKLTAEVA